MQADITFKSDKHENMIFIRHSRRISRQMTKPLMEERWLVAEPPINIKVAIKDLISLLHFLLVSDIQIILHPMMMMIIADGSWSSTAKQAAANNVAINSNFLLF